MSSEAPAVMGEDKRQKRKSITKFMTKVKSNLTPSKIKSKRQSMSAGGAEATNADAAGPSTVGESQAIEESVETPSAPALANDAAAPDASLLYSTTKHQPKASVMDQRDLAISRTKLLFDKYNLQFEQNAYIFTPPRTTERINKAVRVRVHHRCHKCNVVFGNDLECTKCSHRKCKNCPRYPGSGATLPDGFANSAWKKPSLQRQSEIRSATTKPPKKSLYDDPEYRNQMTANLFAKYNMEYNQADYVVSVPRPQIGRIEKQIRVRVHRQCHRCRSMFGGESRCPNCTHSICKKCNRVRPQHTPTHARSEFYSLDSAPPQKSIHDDPQYRLERTRALFQKYNFTFEPSEFSFPDPGDIGPRVEKRSRQRVHRSCHRCMNDIGSAGCANCGHNICSKCPRNPPKREKRTESSKPVPLAAADPNKTMSPPEPSARTSSNRVQSKPKMRNHLRRYCHECNSQFPSKERTCKNCQHEQCVECKRLPANKAPKVKEAPTATKDQPSMLTQLGQQMGLLSVGDTTA